MSLRIAAAACAALSLSACATATVGSQRLEIDPTLAMSSHVDVVRMTSEWVRANEEFGDTFTDALHDNLRRCAGGPRPLELRVHVIGVQRENRLAAVLNGGRHELAAVAELADPATKTVVGRYPIHVVVDAGRPLEALLSDRQLMVSDAFATEVCRQAFGQG